MATYVNNLRLKEIATGDEAGTWGTSTNTNLELVGEGLGFGTEAITTNANTHTTTVADGSADEAGRYVYKIYRCFRFRLYNNYWSKYIEKSSLYRKRQLILGSPLKYNNKTRLWFYCNYWCR